jgi:hypothetical protein
VVRRRSLPPPRCRNAAPHLRPSRHAFTHPGCRRADQAPRNGISPGFTCP